MVFNEIILKFKVEIINNRTSWIQTLSKEELTKICEDLHLQTEGTLDDLRKRLRELVNSGQLSESFPVSNEDTFADCNPETLTMNLNLTRVKQFSGNNFEIFKQQLTCLIALNDIPETKRTPLLLTSVSTKVLETLNHLCSPEKPIKKTYNDLITLLENRYTKSTSTALDRTAFRSRNQQLNESIEDYIIELKKLAKRCGFKDFEDQVKEKFIDSIHKPIIKFELLKNAEQSLDKLIILARTVEAAMTQTKVDNDSFNETGKEMFQLKKRRPTKQEVYQKPRGNYSNRQQQHCFVCGKNNHLKSECSLKNKFCSECGKQGHIFKVCKLRQTRTLEAIEDSDNKVDEIDYNLQSLFTSDEEGQTY